MCRRLVCFVNTGQCQEGSVFRQWNGKILVSMQQEDFFVDEVIFGVSQVGFSRQ